MYLDEMDPLPDYYLKIYLFILKNAEFVKSGNKKVGVFYLLNGIEKIQSELRKNSKKYNNKLSKRQINHAIQFFVKNGWVKRPNNAHLQELEIVNYRTMRELKKRITPE